MSEPAIVDPTGSWTRGQVAASARTIAWRIARSVAAADASDRAREGDDGGTGRLAGVEVGPRVALLCEPGRPFLAALLGVWHAGAVAVPLHPAHPLPELAPLAEDAGISAVVCSPDHRDLAEQLSGPVPVIEIGSDDLPETDDATAPLPDPPAERAALMVFTSGTTGRPKGVLHTHGSVRAQVDALLGPWGWRDDDRALLVLPLHHVHGIMAVVLCSWAAGATCEAPGGFDAVDTWDRLASGEVTVFMAVPTIYRRLIVAWDDADAATRRRWSDGVGNLRLMVSGSAALPVSVLDRWRDLSGHTLLERYGMTEFGLAVSNRLDHRVPGHVGEALPNFEVRRVADDGRTLDDEPAEPGELQVRGPAVFRAYWRRPEATAAAFTDDGWFRTGDVAVHDDDGYRLLGRSSVDILKTGGEKVSAIEIEEVYRTHPAIADAAVVGVPDLEWGQQVALMATPAPGAATADLEPSRLRSWGRERLAPAKVPVRFLVVDALPRNAMGKVTKPAVLDRFTTVTGNTEPESGSRGSTA